MTEYEKGWNAAIAKAAASLVHAPIFPRKDYGGAVADAERISIVETCRKHIEQLRKAP